MAIACRCPHCGHGYRLGDESAGRKAKCKKCSGTFRIPPAGASGAIAMPAETTPAGTPVYRHQPPASETEQAPASTPYLAQITRHIERHFGPVGHVFHELVSEGVHLDLHIVPPTHQPPSEKHPLGTDHFTIITSGMSARPMELGDDPELAEIPRLAELMLALPADWPGLHPDGSIDQEVMKDERWWWPMRWLKTIARMPHDYNTFIAPGHTIPNGEAAEPFAENTRLGCMMVWPSILAPEAGEIVVSDDMAVHLYALWALYPEEMNLKLTDGLEALLDKLQAVGATELVRPDRANACE